MDEINTERDRAPSILHLDDSADDAVLVEFHLNRKRFQGSVRWVDSKAPFAAALAAGGVDLVLSDHRMPGFDGDDALRFVRERHPHLPFITLTGELGEDRAIETMKRGATDYVLKGNLARLVPAIERALREARAGEERRRADVEVRDLKDRLARELVDMRRLHELSVELFRDKDPDAMLQRVLEACVELLRADKGTVQSFDPTARVLALKGQSGFGTRFGRRFAEVAAGQDGVHGKTIESGRRTSVPNVFEDERFTELRKFFRDEGLTGVISSPLRSRDGRVLGILSVHFVSPRELSERELRLLDLYLQQAERVLEYVRTPA